MPLGIYDPCFPFPLYFLCLVMHVVKLMYDSDFIMQSHTKEERIELDVNDSRGMEIKTSE